MNLDSDLSWEDYDRVYSELLSVRKELAEVKKLPYQIEAWMTCPGCGSRWCPTFMVHDELWQQAKLVGWPCILCFERAIGRRLRLDDLKPDVLCNHMLNCGWFLGNRKAGELQ